MSLTYEISDHFIIDGFFKNIAFRISDTEYLFITLLEIEDENGDDTYQIAFDSLQNIDNDTGYDPMPAGKAGFFLVSIFEFILLKHTREFGESLFFAFAASPRLKRFYNALASRYNKRTSSSFVVNIITNTDGDQDETRYEIRRKQTL